MVVYQKDYPPSIQAMFGAIASRYDKTNAIMSLNMHKFWNKKLVDEIDINSSKNDSLLDLCCGTGEIAYKYLEKKKEEPCQVYLLDFCEQMLECARQKAFKRYENHFLTFIEADAQAIPLKDNLVNFITIAYGIRNIRDIEKCFSEAWRVLKPGGTLAILELTRPKNALFRLGHSFYLRFVIPLMGNFVTSEKEAYQYLCSSIHNFIDPPHLAEKLKKAHFLDVKTRPLCCGIATIFTAKKP